MSRSAGTSAARATPPLRSFLPQPGREAIVELAFRRAAPPGGGTEAGRESLECATDHVRAALEEIARERPGLAFDLWLPPAGGADVRWPLTLDGRAFHDAGAVEAYLRAVLEGAGRSLVLHDCTGRAFRLHPSLHLHRAEGGGAGGMTVRRDREAESLAFSADVAVRVPADRRPSDVEAYVVARAGEVCASLRRALRSGPWTLHAPDPRDVPVAPVAWAGETIRSIAEVGEALHRAATLGGVSRWGGDPDGRLVGWSLSAAVRRASERDLPVEDIWSLSGAGCP